MGTTVLATAHRGNGHIACPLNEQTQCGYWCAFGGHLDSFLTAFRRHIRQDHSDLHPHDTRNVGGLIDRWVGDLIVAAQS